MGWICKNCETKNEVHQNACYICGALRDETKAVDFNKQDDTGRGNHSKEIQPKDVPQCGYSDRLVMNTERNLSTFVACDNSKARSL